MLSTNVSSRFPFCTVRIYAPTQNIKLRERNVQKYAWYNHAVASIHNYLMSVTRRHYRAHHWGLRNSSSLLRTLNLGTGREWPDWDKQQRLKVQAIWLLLSCLKIFVFLHGGNKPNLAMNSIFAFTFLQGRRIRWNISIQYDQHVVLWKCCSSAALEWLISITAKCLQNTQAL